jgi:hypothetical protein
LFVLFVFISDAVDISDEVASGKDVRDILKHYEDVDPTRLNWLAMMQDEDRIIDENPLPAPRKAHWIETWAKGWDVQK